MLRVVRGLPAGAAGSVEGVREHALGSPRVAQPAPHPCGWVLVGLRLGARPETLLQRRRIHAARPSSVRRCSEPPASCGLPWAGPAVAVSIYVRPVRAAEGCALPAASMPPRFSLRTPHGRRHPCRRPSMPDGNGLLCEATLVVVEECAAGACCCRGRARTRVGSSLGGGAAPHPCGLVLVGLRLGARLEMLVGRRRIHAARPSSVRRCSDAPASCGLPWEGSGGGRFYLCAARPGRRGFSHCRRHPCRLGSRCEHHTVDGIHAVGLQCRMGTGCFARRRSLSSRSARLGLVVVEGVREHAWGVRWVAGPRRIHAAWSSSVSGWVRGLRCGWGAAASMRLDPRRSDVAQTRPLPAGSPGRGPAVAVSIYVRPVRAAEGLRIAGGIHAASVLAANTTRPTASMPSAFSAGWEQPALQEAPLTFACARDARLGAGRATVGRSSSGGMEAAGALVFARGGSLQDAGGFPKPAARRAAITKPFHRRNFHRGAGSDCLVCRSEFQIVVTRFYSGSVWEGARSEPAGWPPAVSLHVTAPAS